MKNIIDNTHPASIYIEQYIDKNTHPASICITRCISRYILNRLLYNKLKNIDISNV